MPILSVIEMMQQSITTQNKRIDKQDATLQQIISQQQTTKANMEKLSNIMYTIGQKLALFPLQKPLLHQILFPHQTLVHPQLMNQIVNHPNFLMVSLKDVEDSSYSAD